MKKYRKTVILAIAGILLAKIIITLVALPKVTIDYVAEYNELTKPAGFNPEDNAADYYLKAIELYKEPSEELSSSNIIGSFYENNGQFFTNIDPNDLKLMQEWITLNKPAIEQIELAIQKPYCWFKRKAENSNTLGIAFPESSTIRDISQVLNYSAKLNALNGNFKSAVDDILVSYRVGQHQCRENLSIVEQYLGIRIKTETIKTALDILRYSKSTPEELKGFQNSLQTMIDDNPYIPGIEAEKIFIYDTVQRFFLDWVRGINRVAFRLIFQLSCLCGDNNFLWVNCFIGPTRSQVVGQIDRLFELHDQLRDKTQWQIYHQYGNQMTEIEAIRESNFFMRMFTTCFERLISMSQESNAQTDALISVLAILRFKAENNRLPDTLEDLVSNGYMKDIPQDPYGEGALIYKVVDNEFRVYSFGKDFEDNNGEPCVIERNRMVGFEGMDMPGMPRLSLPSTKKTKETIYKDNIYWPEVKTAIKIESIKK